jgi:hypothetical protein
MVASLVITHIFLPLVVLVLNEMVLVLDCPFSRVRLRVLPFGRSTSTKNQGNWTTRGVSPVLGECRAIGKPWLAHNGTHFVRIESRALAATTVFALKTVTRLAPAAQ